MTRNACINHPKDKVIEIPIGAKYCERCRHLVLPEPELEIVEIVQEMALEEESGQSVPWVPLDTESEPLATAVVLEAEMVVVAVLPPLEKTVEEKIAGAELAKKAEIARLKALLAKLEPKTE